MCEELAEDLVEKVSSSKSPPATADSENVPSSSSEIHKTPPAAEDIANLSCAIDINEVNCDPFRTTAKRELQ